jgi:hypothetical protein
VVGELSKYGGTGRWCRARSKCFIFYLFFCFMSLFFFFPSSSSSYLFFFLGQKKKNKKKNRILVEAPQLQDSRFNAYASASRKFGFSNASIIIKSASYGTALGVRCAQRIDVKSQLQNRVDSSLRNDFSIKIEENLDNLFGCRMSPWEGCELRINFEISSFVVRMDLPVR